MKITSDSCVAFSVDDNYINYALALLRGIQKHNIKADIICRAIDMRDTSQLIEACPSINIINDSPGLSTSKTLFKKLDDPTEIYWTYNGRTNTSEGLKNIQNTMYSERAVYSCHSRFKTICELLSEYSTMLCLDADTIVRKNFDNLFDKKECDLYIVPVRVGEDISIFNNEGLLLINNNQNTREFFLKVHDGIFLSNMSTEWDADTHVLLETYEQQSISVGHLDDTYKDKKHHPGSVMWSGDGPRKSEPKFKRCL